MPSRSVAPPALAGLLAVLAGGCAGIFGEPPESVPTGPVAEECLASCERLREQCKGRQEYRERECEARLAAAQADYDLCIESRAVDCVRPDPCLGADFSICVTEYDQCFAACGRQVEIRRSSEALATPPAESAAPSAPSDLPPGTVVPPNATDGPPAPDGPR